jgi:cell division protein FtsZ
LLLAPCFAAFVQINSAAEVIYEAVDPNANIIFGALVDPAMSHGEVAITVIATGM